MTQNNLKLKSVVAAVTETLQISESQVGLTGSLAIGAEHAHDYDIVIYGTIEELNRVQMIIKKQIALNGPVIETGLKWPCRFYDKNKNIICCFFNILHSTYFDEIDVSDSYTGNQRIAFHVKVSDDQYSIAKLPLLAIEDRHFTTLVIFSRAFRGVFRTGDIICGTGIISSDGKTILCFEPTKNINRWTEYFNR